MAKSAASKKPADEVEVFSEEDVPQRSEAWFDIRKGLPTASRFSVILASGKDGEASRTRDLYMKQLAGEILTGEVAETFRSDAMQRGIEMEPEALAWYERSRFVDLEKIGFVKRTVRPFGDPFVAGASPDGKVVGQKRLVEVKTMRPDALIDVTRKGAAGFPAEHRAQCQGNLWVYGADAIDLILFYRGWRSPPVFTIERDDVYCRLLAEQVERFSYELARMVEDVKSRGRW